jgi:hypothetical protein
VMSLDAKRHVRHGSYCWSSSHFVCVSWVMIRCFQYLSVKQIKNCETQ